MVSQTAGFSHFPCLPAGTGGAAAYDLAAARWPGLAARPVAVGGVTVSCDEARAALGLLERAGGIAVRQVLAAAGHPLAGCDYHAAAAPYLDRCPAAGPAAGPRGRGAAGRPLTRTAFCAAVAAVLAERAAAEPGRHFAAQLAAAREAFAGDAGYAAAMARAAVQLRGRNPVSRNPRVTGADSARASERAA